MLKPPFAAAATAVLVTLAGGPFVAGDAHARAVYKGTFDPAFGGNFNGLGWRGEVVFEVPDDCLALGNADFSDVECQSSAVQSASVTLYNLSDLNNIDVLDFFGPQIRLSISGITIAGGTVTGLLTDMLRTPFGPAEPASPGDWLTPAGTLEAPVVDWYDLYRYGLTINGDEALLRASSTAVDYTDSGFEDQLPGNCPWDGDYAICSSATLPTVTFTQVPEPASLALTGLALAALAGLRRRSAA